MGCTCPSGMVGQVEPGCCGAGHHQFRCIRVGIEHRRTVPWSAPTRSVCSGIVLITPGPISSKT
jgi:hypothetical protein